MVISGIHLPFAFTMKYNILYFDIKVANLKSCGDIYDNFWNSFSICVHHEIQYTLFWLKSCEFKKFAVISMVISGIRIPFAFTMRYNILYFDLKVANLTGICIHIWKSLSWEVLQFTWCLNSCMYSRTRSANFGKLFQTKAWVSTEDFMC